MKIKRLIAIVMSAITVIQYQPFNVYCENIGFDLNSDMNVDCFDMIMARKNNDAELLSSLSDYIVTRPTSNDG
jgi:hypothetical protein